MNEPAKTAAPAKKAAPATTKAAPAARKAGGAKTAAAGKQKASVAGKAESAAGSKFFKRAMERAKRISNDPAKLREIAEKAGRSTALRAGPFAAVIDDFRVLIRLVVAYARGLYREIPVDKLAIVVGGLIYVVAPLDLIPDVIPAMGFLDDASVIAWVLKAVKEEIDVFREWEAGLID